MKIICYCRTSKRDMHPENQIPELEKKARDIGGDYVIIEERESTRNTRPVKEDVIRQCRDKQVSTVIVWKLDRFARSSSELALNLDEMKKLRVRFISIRDGLDINPASPSPILDFQYHILGAFAELERELIRERTFAGLERAKAEGKQLGRPKGSKDKKVRRKSGYWLRYANKGVKQISQQINYPNNSLQGQT